jgi:glucosylceramidase
MQKIISVILSLLLLLFVFTCAEKNDLVEQSVKASWKVSTQSTPWQDMEDLNIMKGQGGGADIEIDMTALSQEIKGFGGAFNEKGWEALSLLTPEERDKVLKELFDPEEGAKFNICRVAIGSSDYGVSRYTHNEKKNDYEMKNFSIERDRNYLLPYIKAAMRYRPDLKIWGSVWTVPTWMKTNGAFDGGNMKDDPKIYAAYALYLARFAEEYQKEGINLYAVAVQNEPRIETHYPSCLWTPKQFLTFIRDYMGPVFEERKVKAEIMLGTIQVPDYNQFINTVLSNKTANAYVSLVGFQWRGLDSVARTRKNFPDKDIMQTETECGNWHWKPGFDPDKPQNDWAYGSYTWKKIKAFFDAGVNSYMLWNMILDEEGKSIDSQLPWPQNAAVVIDKNTKQVIYTPMFYAFKHFTYFVEPGAHYVSIISGWGNAIAFLNPDGELVIVLENESSAPETMTVNFADYWMTVELPPESWSTIIVPPLQ